MHYPEYQKILRKKFQINELNLQGYIQNSIAGAYRKDNPKSIHFYNNVIIMSFQFGQYLKS